jgi:hypothetical protein
MIRTIFDENITENPFDTIIYEDEIFPISEDWYINNISYNHVDDLSDPKIAESDKKEDQPQPPSDLIELEPLEVEIKKEFEAITGKPMNLKKNLKPLTELKELAKEAKDIVFLAFRNVANHIAETGAKVYNLAYVLTAAKNLMCPKSAPKTQPRDYAAASEEDKAYASVGGSSKPISQQPLSPQQAKELEQARKIKYLCEDNPNLRSELYDNLDQELKDKIIQGEIELLKTKPIWQNLHPNWPVLDMDYVLNFAIEHIKQCLLLEYLAYQEFLATQCSG